MLGCAGSTERSEKEKCLCSPPLLPLLAHLEAPERGRWTLSKTGQLCPRHLKGHYTVMSGRLVTTHSHSCVDDIGVKLRDRMEPLSACLFL